MLLNNANVKVWNGDEDKGHLVMNVDCLNFKEVE
jgi:hypothetical protein